MFKLVIFLAFGSSLIAGCEKQQTAVSSNPVTNPIVNPQIRYLALGDSYTIGQNVAENERFPYLTALQLRQQQIDIKEPEYIAQTGWSTTNLQSAIQSRNTQGPYDVVTLLIGVNDQYQRLDTAGYRIRFTQLLLKAIDLAGNRKNRVFVLSIPDYSATPFVPASNKAQVRKEIDAFNEINKQVTLQNQVSYTDITPSTREAASDPSLLANDRLHYSAKEHQRWAAMVAPLIKAAL